MKSRFVLEEVDEGVFVHFVMLNKGFIKPLLVDGKDTAMMRIAALRRRNHRRHYRIDIGPDGGFYFYARDSQDRLLCYSARGYRSKQKAQQGIDTLIREMKGAKIYEEVG